MEKQVIAKKDYPCGICCGIIRKGQRHTHYKIRSPKYNKNDGQIGIEYYSERQHLDGCYPILTTVDLETAKHLLKFCRKGKHDFVDEVIPTDDYYIDGSVDETGRVICKWCYTPRANDGSGTPQR